MAKLYTKYPYGCSNRNLADAIREYSDEIIESRADINKVLQLTPLDTLGQNELQSRQTKRITRLSLGIGILSLIIAGFALYISLLNERSSERWEIKQTESLAKLNSDLNVQGNSIRDLLKSINFETDTIKTGSKRNQKRH